MSHLPKSKLWPPCSGVPQSSRLTTTSQCAQHQDSLASVTSRQPRPSTSPSSMQAKLTRLQMPTLRSCTALFAVLLLLCHSRHYSIKSPSLLEQHGHLRSGHLSNMAMAGRSPCHGLPSGNCPYLYRQQLQMIASHIRRQLLLRQSQMYHQHLALQAMLLRPIYCIAYRTWGTG